MPNSVGRPSQTFSQIERQFKNTTSSSGGYLRFTEAKGLYTSSKPSLASRLGFPKSLQLRDSKREAGVTVIKEAINREYGSTDLGQRVLKHLAGTKGTDLSRGVRTSDLATIRDVVDGLRRGDLIRKINSHPAAHYAQAYEETAKATGVPLKDLERRMAEDRSKPVSREEFMDAAIRSYPSSKFAERVLNHVNENTERKVTDWVYYADLPDIHRAIEDIKRQDFEGVKNGIIGQHGDDLGGKVLSHLALMGINSKEGVRDSDHEKIIKVVDRVKLLEEYHKLSNSYNARVNPAVFGSSASSASRMTNQVAAQQSHPHSQGGQQQFEQIEMTEMSNRTAMQNVARYSPSAPFVSGLPTAPIGTPNINLSSLSPSLNALKQRLQSDPMLEIDLQAIAQAINSDYDGSGPGISVLVYYLENLPVGDRTNFNRPKIEDFAKIETALNQVLLDSQSQYRLRFRKGEQGPGLPRSPAAQTEGRALQHENIPKTLNVVGEVGKREKRVGFAPHSTRISAEEDPVKVQVAPHRERSLSTASIPLFEDDEESVMRSLPGVREGDTANVQSLTFKVPQKPTERGNNGALKLVETRKQKLKSKTDLKLPLNPIVQPNSRLSPESLVFESPTSLTTSVGTDPSTRQ